jgi:large subunit ribosomal protein L15
VGRGGKRGAYSGRGLKGQSSRAGRKMKPVIREIIKRYPKLRGYKFGPKIKKPGLIILNLEILDKKFDAGSKINTWLLLEKGIINKIKGRVPDVKILGDGDFRKAFTIEGLEVSRSAKEKIEKAGGSVK